MNRPMTLPQEIQVNPALWRALRKAGDDIRAVQQMVEMFQDRAQAKIAAANQDAREAWGKINAAHPYLDIANVNYVPHDTTEGLLVPVSMRFPTK